MDEITKKRLEEIKKNKTQENNFDIEQPVSRGLEKLESIFPDNRNKVGIEEITLWNNLEQSQKANLIKLASVYVRDENKKDGGKYIKSLSKWLKQQVEKGISKTLKSSPTDNRLFQHTDGEIYSIIYDRIGTTVLTDRIYYQLNDKKLFETKRDLIIFINDLSDEELKTLSQKKVNNVYDIEYFSDVPDKPKLDIDEIPERYRSLFTTDWNWGVNSTMKMSDRLAMNDLYLEYQRWDTARRINRKKKKDDEIFLGGFE